MNDDSLDKIRQQFDEAPYPRVPLEQSPKGDYNALFKHSLVTPYYLHYRRVVSTEGKVILDAGCGTGFKSLILAEANPGAQIVGVDLSEESVKLARQRLAFHGFENVEFHAMTIEDLPSLGMTFDYINCDEVLYLLPDPVLGLQSMRAVLKPSGILRTNLHSRYQREAYYRAQTIFQLLGLMESGTGDFEIGQVIETMTSLKPTVNLKARTWQSKYESPQEAGSILANFLLIGDKGFTIPELFALLDAADLSFINMVNWRHWEVTDLFNDPEDLPGLWGMSLLGADRPSKLHLYELLNPVNRLMDFWCIHPDAEAASLTADEWDEADWRSAVVHLHPQLQTDAVKQDILHCVAQSRSVELSRYIDLPTMGAVMVESTLAACLLPLWDGPQPITALVERYLTLRPCHLATLEPISYDTAYVEIRDFLNRLDVFLYVLLERSTE